MPVSRMTNRGQPGVRLRVGHAAHQDAGRRREEAARLEQQVQARLAHGRQHGRRVLGGAAVGAAVVGDAEAAAEVDVLEAEPGVPHLPGQVGQGPRRAAERLDVEDLRSEVDVQADELEARLAGQAPQQRRGGFDGHAELVGAPPGRDVRVGVRVDVGVHAQRDPRLHAPRARQRVDAVRLAVRLDVDGLHAERDRTVEFVARLADAGEHDLSTGRTRRAGPLRSRRRSSRRRRRRGRGAGAGWPASSSPSARSAACAGSPRRPTSSAAQASRMSAGAVDVDRRAGAGGHLGHRDAVAGELSVTQSESGHDHGILSEAPRV